MVGTSCIVQRVRRNTVWVPLFHFVVGYAESAPVGGGPKPGGRYATQDNWARAGRLCMTCGVSR